MTEMAVSYLTNNHQKLCRAENIAHAIGIVAERRWPDDPTGRLAQHGKISKSTAANIRKGHGSGKSLTRVIKTLGLGFGLEVLETIVGERLEEHLTREHEKAKQRDRTIEGIREKLATTSGRHGADPPRRPDRLAG